MRLLTLSLIASLLAGASVPAQQGRDEPQLTIASHVSLAVFHVVVTDGRGRHVAGLTAGDFVVTEDRRPQTITVFSADEGPATVGLILDNSGSMLDRRADVARAALSFMAASHAEDERFVVNFNEKAALGLPPAFPFTSSVPRLAASLLTAPAGLTALYDAVALGLDHLAIGTLDRKALVVLSDGGDNASVRRLDDVVEMARRSSATMYTIGVYDETNRDRNPRALRRLAELSGGRSHFPRQLDDLSGVWRDIAGAIRSQYTIGYHSTNEARDGRFRTVRITARRDGVRNLRLTTREGYFAPGGAAAR